ncbi:hypothetical protein [Falsirhodobacter sp. 1013]|uniref:hypothetical protein n=1 Tax=Falsirhodobacter sp. 1013 TaxID=3417566 RepID=UPI003EBA70B7
MAMTYHLQSSPAIYTPGVIAWAINGYAFKKDCPQLLNTICDGVPDVPRAAVERLLSEAVPYTVEDETLVFTVED